MTLEQTNQTYTLSRMESNQNGAEIEHRSGVNWRVSHIAEARRFLLLRGATLAVDHFVVSHYVFG